MNDEFTNAFNHLDEDKKTEFLNLWNDYIHSKSISTPDAMKKDILFEPESAFYQRQPLKIILDETV